MKKMQLEEYGLPSTEHCFAIRSTSERLPSCSSWTRRMKFGIERENPIRERKVWAWERNRQVGCSCVRSFSLKLGWSETHIPRKVPNVLIEIFDLSFNLTSKLPVRFLVEVLGEIKDERILWVERFLVDLRICRWRKVNFWHGYLWIPHQCWTFASKIFEDRMLSRMWWRSFLWRLVSWWRKETSTRFDVLVLVQHSGKDRVRSSLSILVNRKVACKQITNRWRSWPCFHLEGQEQKREERLAKDIEFATDCLQRTCLSQRSCPKPTKYLVRDGLKGAKIEIEVPLS